uniref:Uncharacterized protein n=1 Tax=Arundo donax TaxID=35708 RepID=A0A0A9HMU4_ARUDO
MHLSGKHWFRFDKSGSILY